MVGGLSIALLQSSNSQEASTNLAVLLDAAGTLFTADWRGVGEHQ